MVPRLVPRLVGFEAKRKVTVLLDGLKLEFEHLNFSAGKMRCITSARCCSERKKFGQAIFHK